ncbi:MAG: hypothetical protein D3903_01640 [Candidatus Electrothrix sp. GM3_4]|nr:hypothetical protein [Candidatus Electrothrix sp. GM3_4]
MQQLIHSIITILAVLVLFILSAVSSLAVGIGREVCEPYKPLVVQITTQFAVGEENGFGFLVGERDDQFYIVTANHVVRSNRPDNPAKQVVLHFSWDPGSRGYKAELLYTMYGPLDLALLRIDKAKINGAERVSWEGRKWCRRWKLEEEVWFIGRAREWYIPPDKRAGILLRTEADLQGFIQVDINSVQPGTSGAPLLTRNGLVGMVVTDSPEKTRAVNIDYIRRFVSIENPYPWNLIEYGTDRGRKYPGFVVDNWPSRAEAKAMKGGVPVATEIVPQRDSSNDEKREQISLRNSTQKETTVEQPTRPPIRFDKPIREQFTGIDFVRIPAGCFQMGSSDEYKKERYSNEVPVHSVCVDAFWMGKYEVTLAQWARVIGKRPAQSQGSEKYPAVPVTWEEVQGFISKLHKKTGRVFRLPTEAEWEYAARAGTTTARYWGDDISCDKAMYGNDANENSCVNDVQHQGWMVGGAAPVGSYPPNQFGLHDMLGNVKEWCADWYGKEYYVSSPKGNPTGPSASSVDPQARVLRGGSWLDGSRIIRSAARKRLAPGKRSYDAGFRLVLVGQERVENKAAQ